MTTPNNVVPLFINSQDRISIADSTTNFTIALKKSLRNIVALQTSNVVIPRTDTLIGPNNDTLSGFVVVDGLSTPFSLTITHTNYTATTLAAELQSKLNANTTMLSFPITWVVTYDPVAQRMSMVATYPDGATHTWGITFSYTSLIDVIGLGSAGTVAQTFIAPTNLTTLTVTFGRTPSLVRALSYNITSALLTNSINTSYVRSLAKSFNIGPSNDTLLLNAQLGVAPTTLLLPNPSSNVNIAARFGLSTSMSSDGNWIVFGSDGYGAYVFTRLTPSGGWSELSTRIVDPTRDSSVNFGQGQSVAMSGDNNTLALGGFGTSDTVGSTYVFTRIGTDWTQQGTFLVGTGAIGAANQGYSTSLSINGNTLAIGGPGNNTNVGAAWVFTRSAGVWTQQAQLVPPVIIGATARFGASVSLSGSGDRLVVGGPNDDTKVGAAWVYQRTGLIWALTTKIIVPDSIGAAQVGGSVSMSADGNTISFGSTDDNALGASWVYIWTGLVWAYEAKIIAPTLGVGVAHSGGTVALSSSGDTLVIGAYKDEEFVPLGPNRGSVSVYTRVAAVWTIEASRLVGTGSVGNHAQQGFSVATSATGDELAFGGPEDDVSNGASWTFTRALTVWSQIGSKHIGTGGPIPNDVRSCVISEDESTIIVGTINLVAKSAYVYTQEGLSWIQTAELVPNNSIGNAGVGYIASLSSDGNVALITGPFDNTFVGAAWIFTRTAGVWAQTIKLIDPGFFFFGLSAKMGISGLTAVVGGNLHGVSIYRLIFGTWTSTALIGPAGIQTAALDMSNDENTVVLGLFPPNGVQVWVYNGVTWSQQGPNFNTFYTPILPVVSFGSSVSISSDGNTIAVGDESGGVTGVVYIFVRNAGVWSQQAAFTGAGATSGSGTGVALANNGDTVFFSSLFDSGGTGRIWIADRVGVTWTQRPGTLAGDAPLDRFGARISASKSSTNVVGSTGGNVNNGYVKEWIPIATTFNRMLSVTLPDKPYTVFDIFTTLTTLMTDLVATGVGYVVTFDGTGKLIITSTVAGIVTSNTFYVDRASTFDAARWLSTTYLSVQTSETMDFSINNDVLKQVTNHSDNSDNVISDNTTDIQYRKYPAGYTIAAGAPIDIQLRNDRDQIIDLNGSNWIMTIYATIRA